MFIRSLCSKFSSSVRMSLKSCKKLDKSIIGSGFLESFDYVLTDCDGVLWLGNTAIPGSVDTIQALKDLGKQIIYITNNTGRIRSEHLTKIDNLGFPGKLENIVSPAYYAAKYLKSRHFQKKVYVIGSTGITKELDLANIRHLPVGPDPLPENWREWLEEFELDPEVGAVLIGFDPFISYPKLVKAASYLKNPETLFISTNQDETSPYKRDIIVPGAGTFVYALEVVTGRMSTVIGKPEHHLLDCVKEAHPNIAFDRCIMIGDKLNTDIMFGNKHGIRTILVLTGVNTLDDVHTFEKNSDKISQLQVPDYYLPSLGDLKSLIKS